MYPQNKINRLMKFHDEMSGVGEEFEKPKTSQSEYKELLSLYRP